MADLPAAERRLEAITRLPTRVYAILREGSLDEDVDIQLTVAGPPTLIGLTIQVRARPASNAERR